MARKLLSAALDEIGDDIPCVPHTLHGVAAKLATNLIEPEQTHKKVAAVVVWYDDPEITLSDPIGFVLHALNYGALRQMQVVIETIGMEGIKKALEKARSGILSKKNGPFSMRIWAHIRLLKCHGGVSKT